MKIISSWRAFSLVSMMLTLGMSQAAEEFDTTKLTSLSAAFGDGQFLVNAGVNEKKEIVYLIVSPNGEPPVNNRRISHRDGKTFEIFLRYKGLTLEGPSPCRPFVICIDNEVRRHPMKLTEDELMKLLELDRLHKFERAILDKVTD